MFPINDIVLKVYSCVAILYYKKQNIIDQWIEYKSMKQYYLVLLSKL